MIEYLCIDSGRLVAAASPESAELIRLTAPDESEIRRVSAMTSAPADLIAAACDRDERPRWESEEDTHLIVLRVPYEDRESVTPAVTVAFGVVVTKAHIVTVCSVESAVWQALQKSRGAIPPVSSRVPFLCLLFMTVARLYLAHLQRIRSEADAVEQEIHHSMRNEMLIRMLNLEKSLVFFTTSLRGQEPIWDRFKRIHGREVSDEEQDMIQDVAIEFRQARDLAEIHSNVLTGMMDAFASIISNNLNVVMKLLTSVTIILMLPTLIASVYGMNVVLPFQDSPHAFAITMGMSLVLSIAGVMILLRKQFF